MTPATRDESDLAREARLQWVGACALVAIADVWAGLRKTLIPSATPLGGAIDFSGGYIRNAALRSAFLAAEEYSPLLEDHVHPHGVSRDRKARRVRRARVARSV